MSKRKKINEIVKEEEPKKLREQYPIYAYTKNIENIVKSLKSKAISGLDIIEEDDRYIVKYGVFKVRLCELYKIPVDFDDRGITYREKNIVVHKELPEEIKACVLGYRK